MSKLCFFVFTFFSPKTFAVYCVYPHLQYYLVDSDYPLLCSTCPNSRTTKTHYSVKEGATVEQAANLIADDFDLVSLTENDLIQGRYFMYILKEEVLVLEEQDCSVSCLSSARFSLLTTFKKKLFVID